MQKRTDDRRTGEGGREQESAQKNARKPREKPRKWSVFEKQGRFESWRRLRKCYKFEARGATDGNEVKNRKAK